MPKLLLIEGSCARYVETPSSGDIKPVPPEGGAGGGRAAVEAAFVEELAGGQSDLDPKPHVAAPVEAAGKFAGLAGRDLVEAAFAEEMRISR